MILSDIGANTLLIHPETFTRFKAAPNRLLALREYVENGGGLIMVGGYLTFQGIDGKARYHGTPVEEALPVMIFPTDDRQETPEGVTPLVSAIDHPISAGLARQWPNLLGYNRLTSKPEATIVAVVGKDPLIVAGAYGKGRGVAFASDCGPHWRRLHLSSGTATHVSGDKWRRGRQDGYDRFAKRNAMGRAFGHEDRRRTPWHNC